MAAAVLDHVRHKVIESEESRLQLGDNLFDLFAHTIDVRRRLFECEGRAAELEEAFAAAEQGMARLFLEALGKSRAHEIGNVSPALREQERNLLAELRRTEQDIEQEGSKPLAARDAERVPRLLERQKSLKADLDKLIQRMEQAHPNYAALKYPHPCSLDEARACLAANETALLFVLGTRESCVVLVDKEARSDDPAKGLAVYRLPPAREIADLVAALTDHETLSLPARTRTLGAKGYQLLLAPLADRIRGRDLVIVSSGALCHLPFELLVEGTQFLVENHRIRYAPSLSALHLIGRWQKTRRVPQQTFWAMGDPVYETADERLQAKQEIADTSEALLSEYTSRERGSASKFERLPFSGQELRRIRDLLGADASDVRTGLMASEAAVKLASRTGALARSRYVHFATHGILGMDLGRQPSLVLNLVGNDGKDDGGGLNDGFLQLDEVTNLKLNADLVVLSACRSGQGQLHNGEGVRGLARAFLYAGSRGLVCSLWTVEDRETSQMMTAFYSHLKAGQSSPDALRAARLEMLRAGKAPFYWAPFILVGE